MAIQPTLQAVIDTNVVFEGITTQGSAPGLIIEAWRGGLFVACVSTALAYEYLAVCSGKLSTARWQQLQPVVGRPPRPGTLCPNLFFVAAHVARPRR